MNDKLSPTGRIRRAPALQPLPPRTQEGKDTVALGVNEAPRATSKEETERA